MLMTSKKVQHLWDKKQESGGVSYNDKSWMLSDVKRDTGDAESLLEEKHLRFYLPTDNWSSVPSDLKTHITANKVSWGAFYRANITASRDRKVSWSQPIWLLECSMENYRLCVNNQDLSDGFNQEKAANNLPEPLNVKIIMKL